MLPFQVTRQYHVTGRGIPQLMPGKMLLGWERLEAGSSEGVGAGSAAGASAAGGDGAAGPSKHVPTLVMALGTVPGKEAAATRKRQAPSSDTHHVSWEGALVRDCRGCWKGDSHTLYEVHGHGTCTMLWCGQMIELLIIAAHICVNRPR